MYSDSEAKVNYHIAKKKYPEVDEQYLKNAPYYGRHCQDKYLNDFIFNGMQYGVFVDIGAYDGVESSNTLFFEESLQWHGICVEPLSIPYQKLVKNRKKSICLNLCASSEDEKALFMHVCPSIRPLSPREAGRTSNYEKLSGLTKFYSDNERQLISDIISQYGGKTTTYEINCLNINTILSMTGEKRIDLLSIDTEGSEEAILTAIDYKSFDIRVIVTEGLNCGDALILYLHNKGYYKATEIGYDWIFLKGVI